MLLWWWQLCGEQLIKLVKGSLCNKGFGSSNVQLMACLKRSIVPRSSALVLSTLALLGVRMYVMGSQLPVFTRFDNPASAAAFPARHLTFNFLPALNGWLLSFPSALCCDWTMGTVHLVETFADARNLATLAFYVLLVRLVWMAFIQGDTTIIMVNR